MQQLWDILGCIHHFSHLTRHLTACQMCLFFQTKPVCGLWRPPASSSYSGASQVQYWGKTTTCIGFNSNWIVQFCRKMSPNTLLEIKVKYIADAYIHARLFSFACWPKNVALSVCWPCKALGQKLLLHIWFVATPPSFLKGFCSRKSCFFAVSRVEKISAIVQPDFIFLWPYSSKAIIANQQGTSQIDPISLYFCKICACEWGVTYLVPPPGWFQHLKNLR